jgi:outer membrane receptor protein involved in Fe transport
MLNKIALRSGAKAALLTTVGVTALIASPVHAQQVAAAEIEAAVLEDIVVTGSRVARQGFEAPTPTTVLGTQDLERVAASNVADLVNQMPVARPTQSPTTNGSTSAFAGGNYLDLRGLGPNRTLVLVDGRRFVNSQIEGSVDINVIPQALIGGIDIVTGGASAAYGSDAVAGVVNFRFNHQLEGFKGSLQGGTTDHKDHNNVLASLGYGKRFADGRGKVLVAGEYSNNDGVPRLFDRDWGRESWAIIPNPSYTAANSEPRNLLVADARQSNMTYGGLITSGPLAGTQFGPGGVPQSMTYGTLRTSSAMMGGDGANPTEVVMLEVPLERQTLYGRVSYEITPSLTAFAEGSWAQSETSFISTTRTDTALRITRENPFLPAAIAQAMDSNSLTSFTMGRFHRDNGIATFFTKAQTRRFVGGLEGDLGRGWSFDAYYTHGETKNQLRTENNRINARFAQAVDAVRDPATGAAMCRSATARADGCVAMNLFGDGSPSAQSLAWVNGESYRQWDLQQDVASATLQGEPVSTWAGPVSVAAGAEYRRESADVTANALTAAFAFGTGNVVPWKGKVTVKELFGEAVIPLAKDMSWTDSIELNIAGRLTDYSTSGTVTTWKVGGTWDVNSDLTFRATRSRDIRAPSLNELFAEGTSQVGNVLDPQLGRIYSVQRFNTGNPNLKPEKADTLTLGVVYSPPFVPNLRTSVDYYDIDMKGAILTLASDAIVERCYTNTPSLCAFVIRGGNGEIARVIATPANLQSVKTSGVDFEVAYRMQAFEGDLSLRTLVTYIHNITMVDAGSTIELAGSASQPGAIGGQPHWRWTSSATYERDRLTVSLTGRYIGKANLDNAYTTKDLNKLNVGARVYLDASASYDLIDDGERRLALFANVRNLLDKDPPITGVDRWGTTRALYDTIGRTYTAGVRFNF